MPPHLPRKLNPSFLLATPPPFQCWEGFGQWTISLKVQVWISPAGCAGWARNPNRPQVTPFFHQLGHRGTILDISNGVRRRISLRISPGGSHPLNLNFFGGCFSSQKSIFCGEKRFTPPPDRGTWVKSLCGHIGNMTHPCVAILGI